MLAQADSIDPSLSDVLSGGMPAAIDSLPTWPLYLAGHADGVVRLWGMAAAAPTLAALVAVPPATRSAAVTAVEMCPVSGMLAVGRASGVVDLFQFLHMQRTVVVHTLAAGGGQAVQTQERQQLAGFQHVLRVLGDAVVGALTLASRHRLLASGDKDGGVTVVDLSLVGGCFVQCCGSVRACV